VSKIQDSYNLITNARKGRIIMKFRPCIDIHNGKVKQIVGGSLKDAGNQAQENFVSEQDAAFYASLYKEKGLKGGHIILLNSADSEYFQATKAQAMLALGAYPGGLQIGGGVNPDNAADYLAAGASHVIVTSYVFRDGHISWKNLEKMVDAAGKEHLVLDLSCRKKEDAYYVVTDRWQKFTEEKVTLELMEKLGAYCDEFLIHAVDVEGKAKGIEVTLAKLLGEYNGHPVTYAGGVGSMEDIQTLKMAAGGKVDVTVGSALDLFGGTIPFEKLIGNL
jgi:phosphoribosylformimino-5-aminoimidazole carboxamide ribotide isomerase